ncbi:MAG: segregation/condensation protein A [Bacillota bacterium]|nr:segregation/condensation protein A [Bacillota bacterium]
MPLNIKISNFEGPFDLLLHLIKKNEMDIYDIKIHDITNQYLQYLKEMEELDLEIASEFIVIAATLIEAKSKLLLPKPKQNEVAVELDDPRKEIIDRLVEYRKYKLAAEFFKQKEAEQGITFSKKPEIIEDKKIVDNNDIFKNISILDLYNLYSSLMKKYLSKINTSNVIQNQIPLDNFKIEDKMLLIDEIINNEGRFYFSNIIKESSSKIEVVVTFLALLELIKLKTVKIYQEDNFYEILIERIQENG